MATIYSLVIDADNCPVETVLFHTEAERDAAALEAIKGEWRDDQGPMPANWRDAYEALHNRPGWCDLSLHSDDHEIDVAQLADQVQA